MTRKREPVVRMPAGFDASADACRVLHEYYHSGLYSGAHWDDFDPSGKRAESADRFTADDLLACSLLSIPIGGDVAVTLLKTLPSKFDWLLARIPDGRRFVEYGDDDEALPFDSGAVDERYRELVRLRGIGETTATKLLARKRPHLVPIVDSEVTRVIFGGGRQHWAPLHAALTADGCARWKRLEYLRSVAGLPDHVPVLRVLDVLAWMDGTGRTAQLIESDTDQE